MKNTIFCSVTAILCTAILSITTMTGINGIADAKIKAAEKFAQSVPGNSSVSDSFVSDEESSYESTDTPQTPSDVPTDTPADTPTDTPADENLPTSGATENKPDAPDTMTTEEIVKMFNTSANKIKTDAVKVVKNYEKRVVNEDKLVFPEAIEKTGRDMIKTFMADDTEPIVYDTKEEIRNEYIVPDQDYVSKLQPSTVQTATCVDKGSTYEIYFKLKEERNPHAGSGVAAVCDVIEPHEVTEKNLPFIKRFDATYYNCEIKATIDKKTGRMIHTYYSTPVVLDMTLNLFGTHDVQAGFTFIKDYTITY